MTLTFAGSLLTEAGGNIPAWNAGDGKMVPAALMGLVVGGALVGVDDVNRFPTASNATVADDQWAELVAMFATLTTAVSDSPGGGGAVDAASVTVSTDLIDLLTTLTGAPGGSIATVADAILRVNDWVESLAGGGAASADMIAAATFMQGFPNYAATRDTFVPDLIPSAPAEPPVTLTDVVVTQVIALVSAFQPINALASMETGSAVGLAYNGVTLTDIDLTRWGPTVTPGPVQVSNVGDMIAASGGSLSYLAHVFDVTGHFVPSVDSELIVICHNTSDNTVKIGWLIVRAAGDVVVGSIPDDTDFFHSTGSWLVPIP